MNTLDRLNNWLFLHQDKVCHFAAGAILAGVGSSMGLFGIVMLPLMVGFLKEVWDHFNPPHQCELWDFLAVMLGAVPVWLAYWMGTHHV